MNALIELLTSKLNNRVEVINEIFNWQKIPINHGNIIQGSVIKGIKNIINDSIGICETKDTPLRGVYAYYDNCNEQFLYIGKTARLSNAIHRHYNEARGISAENQNQKNRDFFPLYLDQLTIYFKKIDKENNDKKIGEPLRIIIEMLLIIIILPEFEIKYPTITRHLK